MRRSEIQALRNAAEIVSPQGGKRFAIVQGRRVRMMDLSQEQAENYRNDFFPFADVVPMEEVPPRPVARPFVEAVESQADYCSTCRRSEECNVILKDGERCGDRIEGGQDGKREG